MEGLMCVVEVFFNNIFELFYGLVIWNLKEGDVVWILNFNVCLCLLYGVLFNGGFVVQNVDGVLSLSFDVSGSVYIDYMFIEILQV